MCNSIYLTADRMPLIRDIGWYQTNCLYTHPNRLLEYDVFLFVAKGKLQVIEEGTEYIVEEKEHLFLKKGQHHWGLHKSEPGTSWYWIHFTAVLDDRICYKEHLPMPEMVHYNPDHYEYQFELPKYGTSIYHLSLEHKLLKLLDNYHEVQTHQMTKISIQIYQLFLELQQAMVTPVTEKNTLSKQDTLTGKVLFYLNQQTDKDFNSHYLSHHLNLNYSYLSSAFKKLTGQSILEVHTKLRMNKAIDLMRNTSMNVSEISEQLGYKNPFYFSRVFKKVMGEAPSTFSRHFYKS